MCIHFNNALFGLRGTLEHIFDCMYIADNMSDAADQILTKPAGIMHLFVLFWHIKICTWLVWWGCYNICLLVIDWPKGGQRSWGLTYLPLPCFWRIMLLCGGPKKKAKACGSIKRFWLDRKCLFLKPHSRYSSFPKPQRASNKNSWFLHPTTEVFVLSVCVESFFRVSNKITLLFLPCLEVVEPWALVRRWRTESGLWWRVESWNAWKVLMDRLERRKSRRNEHKRVRYGWMGGWGQVRQRVIDDLKELPTQYFLCVGSFALWDICIFFGIS